MTDEAYRVFTRRFDRVVGPADLDRQLWSMGAVRRAQLNQAWESFTEGIAGWRTAAAVRALEVSQRIRAQVEAATLADTAVCLLVDHSGSMRGQNMLLAAAAADIARTMLVGLGVKCELLGFTTRSWKGGRSRLLWNFTGRRRRPGRLNDLLHVVYIDFDDCRPGACDRRLIHMLRYDLLKENLDGEAVEWAASRLRERQERRRVIVMLSDGAPVDDSTLQENGPRYLQAHLKATVAGLSGEMVLAQLQIGEEWPAPFPLHARAATPVDLSSGLIDLVERAQTAPEAQGDR